MDMTTLKALAQELTQKAIEIAESLRTRLGNGFQPDDLPVIYESAARAVEAWSELHPLTGEEKKALAILIVQDFVNQQKDKPWFDRMCAELARRLKAIDLPGPLDMVVDPMITAKRVREYIVMAADQAIEQAVKMLNRYEWKPNAFVPAKR